MNPSISAKAVENQITSDINACKALLDLLDREQQALKDKDPDALANIIEQKVPPLAHLEESAKQRAQWANISDEEKSSQQWESFLNEFQRPTIKDDWEELKSLTLQCREKNEVNGKILIRQQQVYGRLLELLRGQTKAPDLYNAYGAATTSTQSIKLDEA